MKHKLYIAGKITGYTDREFAEKRLEEMKEESK